ncbi:thiamine pyrophosphokinase [Williamsoniiplasma somnilux]|uniref:Thiamine diphosphokinase n=1 Tax=Williamsoniiplasma somnilux TaxID=215578 RepID=A0A2K8NXN9_9MOLU|nr:thiamine diphosphokinase [Williamsoniiplasma somnilux]ATZ18602.1 thiamine pyrophosphokinase [Williamsoniiplasma somnilux]
MYNRVLIVTAKTNQNYKYFNNDNTLIIGVERGCLDLIEKNIKIDFAVGDFDKVELEEINLIKAHCKNFELASSEKDFLDGELAILKAKEITDSPIFFVANATKRYDKNLSIFGLVVKYNITMFNDETTIFKILKPNQILKFEDFQDKTYISFFSWTDTLISIENMKYNLKNYLLKPFDNFCISNELITFQDAYIKTNQDIICIATK